VTEEQRGYGQKDQDLVCNEFSGSGTKFHSSLIAPGSVLERVKPSSGLRRIRSAPPRKVIEFGILG